MFGYSYRPLYPLPTGNDFGRLSDLLDTLQPAGHYQCIRVERGIRAGDILHHSSLPKQSYRRQSHCQPTYLRSF